MIAKSNKHFGTLRDWWACCGPFDTVRLLQSQAFGTKKCLEALKASGRDIPQETIDMFAPQEKQFEEEVAKLNPSEIPEDDLALSPLKLDSQFVDMRALVGFDPLKLSFMYFDLTRRGLLLFALDFIYLFSSKKTLGIPFYSPDFLRFRILNKP